MSDGPPPGFNGTFNQALEIVLITNYFEVAAAALVVYDAIIAFPQEAKLLWRGRWGIPAVIYLLNRYGVILQAGFNIITVLDADLSTNACMSFNSFSNWTIPAIILLIEAMLVLRITALYGNDLRVAIPMWTLWTASAAAMCAFTGIMLASTFPIGSPAAVVTGCELDGSESLFWAVWVPSLILEMTMVILTLSRTIYHRRRGVKTPILTVLVRDGFVYFVVVFNLMLIDLVICLTTSLVYYSLMVEMTLCISSVLCSRLFLNLRDMAYTQGIGLTQISGMENTYELHHFAKEALPSHPVQKSSSATVPSLTSVGSCNMERRV